MMEISTAVGIDRDASGAVERATERLLLDAADAGFQKSQEAVPVDQATLLQSGVPPTVTRDGSVVWGYNAKHALPVEEGSEPHWPPIDPLRGWARRVLGDESAAYAVQQKIAEEGTDAQPYARPGAEVMKAHLRGGRITKYIEEEL